jgi:hypothetical protein
MSAALAIWDAPPEYGLEMSENFKITLLSAFGRLMRPLVRILLRNGVAYGEFADLVKRIFVDVGASAIRASGGTASESKVAIKTGLSRAEVARILSQTQGDGNELEAQTNRVGWLLTLWHQDTGPYGIPLELPFDDKPGRRSFCELVRRSGAQDVSPADLLEELTRVGAAAQLPNGLIRVLARSYLPAQTDPAALEFMSVAFTDLASTLARNLEYEDRSKFFERRVWTPHGIASKDVAAFEDMVNQQGQHFLETLDDWLTSRETEARKSHEEVVRVGVATYMFQREKEQED